MIIMRSRGFTIFELLVVLTVIFILIGLFAGVFQHQQRKVQDTRSLACSQQLRQHHAEQLAEVGHYLAVNPSSPGLVECKRIMTMASQSSIAPFSGYVNLSGVHGKVAPSLYVYLVRNPAGIKTYVVTESYVGSWEDRTREVDDLVNP